MSVRQKVGRVLFALLAIALLVGVPTSTAFAGCSGSTQSSCT